jgi:hypothetical protein
VSTSLHIASGKVPVSTIGVESGTVASVIVTIDGWGGARTASGRCHTGPAAAAWRVNRALPALFAPIVDGILESNCGQ